jgi:hypothetical protein
VNITISRSLPIETNIWKGHKNKGEVSKNEGGISKITPSIEPRNCEYDSLIHMKMIQNNPNVQNFPRDPCFKSIN